MKKELLARLRAAAKNGRRLGLLLALAAALGALAGVLDAVFGRGILAVTAVREQWPLLMLLLPAAGVLMVSVYARWGGDCARGMGLVFDTVAGRRDKVPARLIPLAVGATWLGHLCGASVGREGVAVQIASAAGSLLTPALPDARAKRRLMIAAVAAGFAGLFRTPLAAVFFALELFHTGVMEYEALLPAFVAALAANAVSGLLGVVPGTAALGAAAPAFDPRTLAVLMRLGVACGRAGRLFVALLHGLKRTLARRLPDPCLRIALAGAAVAAFGLLTAGRYNGLSAALPAAALAGEALLPWDWLAKLVLTALCLAAGYQGGEVAPLFAIGAALGAVLAAPLGLPAGLAAALCYTAVFAAGTNTLLSPVLVGLELFGGEYFGCFFVVCALSYLCNGGHSIYPQACPPDPWAAQEAEAAQPPRPAQGRAGKPL